MRKAVLILLLALALAAPASAAVRESPYQASPTRSCLTRHGAHRLTFAHPGGFGFGEPYVAFVWTRRPTVWIGIEFTPNPARGLASERRVRHILHGYFGYGAAWIRRHLMRRANVVIAAYTMNRPLTAGQKALLLACLRR